MVDEVVTMVTRDMEWFAMNRDTSFLTPEQQGYYLFGLMAIFIIGLIVYLYIKDKEELTE